MALPYNNISNVTTFSQWISFTNTATSQMYGHMLILVIWVIAFMALGNRPKEDAFAASSFITFLAAVLLWGMGGVSAIAVILTTIALIGSAIILLKRQ